MFLPSHKVSSEETMFLSSIKTSGEDIKNFHFKKFWNVYWLTNWNDPEDTKVFGGLYKRPVEVFGGLYKDLLMSGWLSSRNIRSSRNCCGCIIDYGTPISVFRI